MERLNFRSTSVVDLQAELRERDLLSDSRRAGPPRGPSRPRAMRFGLRQLTRRILG
jgi:hypothetical protein